MTLKFTEELCVMTMKNNTKIELELTCRFKIDMKNFTNFDPSTKESLKKVCFNWLLVAKVLFELQKYRGLTFHDTEEICKF